MVGAPDAELSQAATLLSPEAKRQLLQHLQAFTPNLAQSLGARAVGIDIEGQRKRMMGLLNPGGAAPGAVKAGASRYREAAMLPTVRALGIDIEGQGKDADLDPLRQREDFRKLVAELERKRK